MIKANQASGWWLKAFTGNGKKKFTRHTKFGAGWRPTKGWPTSKKVIDKKKLGRHTKFGVWWRPAEGWPQLSRAVAEIKKISKLYGCIPKFLYCPRIKKA